MLSKQPPSDRVNNRSKPNLARWTMCFALFAGKSLSVAIFFNHDRFSRFLETLETEDVCAINPQQSTEETRSFGCFAEYLEDGKCTSKLVGS